MDAGGRKRNAGVSGSPASGDARQTRAVADESEIIVQLPLRPLESAEYAVPHIPRPPKFATEARTDDVSAAPAPGSLAQPEASDGGESDGDAGPGGHEPVTSGTSPGADHDSAPTERPDTEAAEGTEAKRADAAPAGSASGRTRRKRSGSSTSRSKRKRGPGGSGSGSGRHASQRVPAERKRSGPRAVPAEEEVGAGGAEADAIVGSALESAAAVTEAATKGFPEPPRRDVGARTVAGAALDAVSGHDIRFGELARLERFATAEQVTEALRIQERLLQDGRRRKIGKIMVKLGYLTTIQAKYILRLQRTEDPITGYKLLERRGQGGMGVVYRAVQKSLKREVALKILAPRFATQKRFLQRFLREAKLAGELNHTNLVSAIDFGESNGYYYIAMEYVDGWSVSEMLQEDGPFDEEEALKILIQVARGLEHASEKHIVHRDVKPENILVTPDGVAKLTDLGLSKQLTSDCSITVEGKTLGTPFYVSPELARGTKGVDVRSDLYSLGCTVYHMLAGEPPFTGDNAAAVMACHIAEDPRPLRKLAPDGSRPVQRLIQRLMEKDPDDRYQTPQELVSDIVAIQRGRNPFATRSIGEGGSGRLTPVRGTGRHAAVTSRRFAVPKSLDDRDRRSGGAAPANNSAVIVLLVVFILGGILLTVVV
ncbi:MAG: serine/threonine-protein kinase, partial [Planctomycetota bacterium]